MQTTVLIEILTALGADVAWSFYVRNHLYLQTALFSNIIHSLPRIMQQPCKIFIVYTSHEFLITPF